MTSGPCRDCVAGRRGRRAQLVAAILDRAIELDAGHGLAFGAQIVEEALLVLEPPLADDVQLRVVAFRASGHARHRGALELRQVLASQIADEVRGGVDRLAVDRLHVAPTIRAPVSACLSRGRYDLRVVAKRRDGEGKISIGPTWESIVERQIREAMEDGAFDELPYRGVPIPLDDDSAAGERALGFRVLRNAGVAPPWIEADKEVRDLLAPAGRAAGAGRCRGTSPLARARLRRAFEHVVLEANRAIERLNAEAPTDRQHRRPLDPAAEVARLEAAFGA